MQRAVTFPRFFLLEPSSSSPFRLFVLSAAVHPYDRALRVCGGFLLVIGANSSGHLPARVRLWSGLADHSVEGHSSTCPPGREPGWNSNTQRHVFCSLLWVFWMMEASCTRGECLLKMLVAGLSPAFGGFAESSAACVFSA